jgi:putative flippase GtrA
MSKNKKLSEKIKYLWNIKFINFLIIGTSGVFLNLLISFFIVEFILNSSTYFLLSFSIKHTTIGIISGISVNMLFNFYFFTKSTFKTKKNHIKRFFIFLVYAIFITYIVNLQTTLLLRDFLENILFDKIAKFSYLIASIVVIITISIINFFVFKFWLFKE